MFFMKPNVAQASCQCPSMQVLLKPNVAQASCLCPWMQVLLALALSVCVGVCPGRAAPAGQTGAAEWEATIREAAPRTAPVEPKKDRTVLVFSRCTGFHHDVIPQTEDVVRILGEVTEAYRVVNSNDIEQFLPENLGNYDAVVLNNNCPDRKERNLFRDVLVHKVEEHGKEYADLPLAEREALAATLYDSLVDYVAEGGGLVVLHGAIANFNFSDEFSAMVGGSFHYHPPAQEVILHPVEPDHPLLTPFQGKPFVHRDEPYLFNRAYAEMNFRPLLEIDTSNMGHLKQIDDIRKMKRYAAWIKPHEQGRVFYCSPSHMAESLKQPPLLQFILGGIQYALGDLDCPDTPPATDDQEGP